MSLNRYPTEKQPNCLHLKTQERLFPTTVLNIRMAHFKAKAHENLLLLQVQLLATQLQFRIMLSVYNPEL